MKWVNGIPSKQSSWAEFTSVESRETSTERFSPAHCHSYVAGKGDADACLQEERAKTHA